MYIQLGLLVNFLSTPQFVLGCDTPDNSGACFGGVDWDHAMESELV